MLAGPFKDEPQRAVGPAVDQLQRVNRDFGEVLAVAHVEVRRRAVAEVYRDHDAVEGM